MYPTYDMEVNYAHADFRRPHQCSLTPPWPGYARRGLVYAERGSPSIGRPECSGATVRTGKRSNNYTLGVRPHMHAHINETTVRLTHTHTHTGANWSGNSGAHAVYLHETDRLQKKRHGPTGGVCCWWRGGMEPNTEWYVSEKQPHELLNFIFPYPVRRGTGATEKKNKIKPDVTWVTCATRVFG